MKSKGKETRIYHITDIENLPQILKVGGLLSDAKMVQTSGHAVIGYDHIKKRRLEQIKIAHSGRYVGEYVPFYFCPRSPMLYTINEGNTGRKQGCQKTVLHLVSTIKHGMKQTNDWVISDGNAGTFYTSFYHDLSALDDLDWSAIREKYWQAVRDKKSAEFLVADFFAWQHVIGIGCFNEDVANQVRAILTASEHQPVVKAIPSWYY
ncbi:MAG: DUF4433 domain-containing protein [Mariprofundaceae bacterium]|nr:DUF4433 domain-containing protein [Mariprofundaceae bacterium]